jgi:hypothetical protein
MPQSISSRSRSALAATVLLVLASLVLAACGGSAATTSTTATATTNASATGTTTPGATTPGSTTKAPSGAPAANRGHFLALRECLQKNGIALPKRKPGQAPGAGLLPGGVSAPPKGVTAAQYRAALKKCGGGFPARRFGGPVNRLKTPVFRQALAKFAACLRSNGVNIPPPNTSGKGPIFNTKGVNVAGPKFKAAQVKCASVLRSGLRASPGTAKAAAPGGAAPAG